MLIKMTQSEVERLQRSHLKRLVLAAQPVVKRFLIAPDIRFPLVVFKAAVDS